MDGRADDDAANGHLSEQTVDRFVRGALQADLRAAVETHLAACASCVELVGLAVGKSGDTRKLPPPPEAARPGQVLSAGAVLGRYTVLSLVGRGGSAEVYAAYDPELDRKVALKLIHDTASPGQAARLVREAKALARLSHPNVVTVHEVGTYGEQVYIAMEFVQGQTLAAWCKVESRPQRDILEAFLAAGRGLAAAHAAGLVHRDFKPQNVMVRDDGQVRVMDFGLARQLDDVTESGTLGGSPRPFIESGTLRGSPRPPALAPRGEAALHSAGPEPEASPSPSPSSSSSPSPTSPFPPEQAAPVSDQLTRTGALVGTPLYMAPEQIAGGTVGARTDQFAFCVSLYIALHGRQPFAGRHLSELFANVTAGRLQDPPAGSRVPAWLHRVVVRGLRAAADERWPSMHALLAALARDPARGWRRAAVAAGAVVLLGGAALVVARGSGAREAFCQQVPARLRGAWDPGPDGRVRATVSAAFARTGRVYAASTVRAVSSLIDRYASGWIDMYTDACEATHVRGEQSAEVLDLRMECLQDRLRSLKALTDVFSSADGAVVENAVSAVSALPPLARCADVKLLREVVPPPSDPVARRRVEEVRRDLAMMKALGDAGRCAAAAERAGRLIAAARELGYDPLLAEALDAAGWLGNDCLDARTAAGYASEAAGVAETARHDELGANAAVLAATMLGERLGELREAAAWAERAGWKIRRIGGSPLLESWRQVAIGNALALEGRYQPSLAAQREALALKEKLLGPDHIDVARSLGNVSYVLGRLGRADEALAAADRAVGIVERHLGADHPLRARLEENRGAAMLQAGRAEEARRTFEGAVEIWRRSGSDELFQVEALVGAGESAARAGSPDGIGFLERAVRIAGARDHNPAQAGAARFALARALWTQPAERARAHGLSELALRDFERLPALRAEAAEVRRWLESHLVDVRPRLRHHGRRWRRSRTRSSRG